MASFKDSIFSELSGKIGPVVIYMRQGKQVVRSNNIPRDPKTPKQLAHRMKFSLSNKGLSPLKNVIKAGHQGDAGAYRKIVGEAYHTAIVGEYPNFSLDYSKINIAKGDLQLITDLTSVFDSGGNYVKFSWNPKPIPGGGPARGNDQVNIVCFNKKLMIADQFSAVARRNEGAATLELPNGWKLEDTSFWVYLSSIDLHKNSESVYIEVELMEESDESDESGESGDIDDIAGEGAIKTPDKESSNIQDEGGEISNRTNEEISKTPNTEPSKIPKQVIRKSIEEEKQGGIAGKPDILKE